MAPDLGSPRTALHLGSPRTAPDPARPRATPRRAPLAWIAEVNRLGYADIEWTTDTTDTTGYKGAATGMTVQKAVKRAVDALRPGAIIQMHVGSLDGQGDVLDAQALPQIIDAVRARGYRVTSPNTLLTPA